MTVEVPVQCMERCLGGPVLERVDDKSMWLLTRLEGHERVYIYDVFSSKELKRMKKRGWKVVVK